MELEMTAGGGSVEVGRSGGRLFGSLVGRDRCPVAVGVVSLGSGDGDCVRGR